MLSSSVKPGRVRWAITGFLLAIITYAYVTRLAISIAAQQIQSQLRLSDVEVGGILSAFIVGYGIFQIPVGILTDRFGAHRVLTAAILGWSALTFVTGLVPRFANSASLAVLLFLGVRFVTGIAQAAALPCGNKTISRWMPLRERATGNSVFMIGLGIGGAVTPPAVTALMLRYGWPVVFYGLGLAGIALAGLWYRLGSDRPEEHPRIGEAELAWIHHDAEATLRGSASPPTPWRALLTSRSVWALALSYGIAGYPSYVFMTWFFLYIVNVRGVEITAGGYWSALPFVLIAFMTPMGGKLSDALTSRYGKRLGRLSVVLAGSVAAAVLIAAGARVANVELAVILLACAAGSHLFGQAPSWAATIDIVPTHSATLFGLMNTLAQLAGAISPVLTPLIAARFGWVAALDFAALMTLSAGLIWTFVRPDVPVQLARVGPNGG